MRNNKTVTAGRDVTDDIFAIVVRGRLEICFIKDNIHMRQRRLSMVGNAAPDTSC